ARTIVRSRLSSSTSMTSHTWYGRRACRFASQYCRCPRRLPTRSGDRRNILRNRAACHVSDSLLSRCSPRGEHWFCPFGLKPKLLSLHERRDDGRCFPIVRGSEHEHADAPHPLAEVKRRSDRV